MCFWPEFLKLPPLLYLPAIGLPPLSPQTEESERLRRRRLNYVASVNTWIGQITTETTKIQELLQLPTASGGSTASANNNLAAAASPQGGSNGEVLYRESDAATGIPMMGTLSLTTQWRVTQCECCPLPNCLVKMCPLKIVFLRQHCRLGRGSHACCRNHTFVSSYSIFSQQLRMHRSLLASLLHAIPSQLDFWQCSSLIEFLLFPFADLAQCHCRHTLSLAWST